MLGFMKHAMLIAVSSNICWSGNIVYLQFTEKFTVAQILAVCQGMIY